MSCENVGYPHIGTSNLGHYHRPHTRLNGNFARGCVKLAPSRNAFIAGRLHCLRHNFLLGSTYEGHSKCVVSFSQVSLLMDERIYFTTSNKYCADFRRYCLCFPFLAIILKASNSQVEKIINSFIPRFGIAFFIPLQKEATHFQCPLMLL